MFGSNNKDTKETSNGKSSAQPSRGLNTVNEGTTLTGDLEAQSDIRVDGTINGDLRCKAKVIVGPKGKIKGTVVCENAVIEGGFSGKLEVKDMLTIKETAKVNGDVITRKVAMMAGCDFEGTISTKGGKGGSDAVVGGERNDKVANLKQKEQRAGA